jgi:hypothetical protein
VSFQETEIAVGRGNAAGESVASVRLDKALEACPKLVSDASERSQSVLFRALHGRGIFYVPMDAPRPGWKGRTALFCVIADYHVVELLIWHQNFGFSIEAR